MKKLTGLLIASAFASVIGGTALDRANDSKGKYLLGGITLGFGCLYGARKYEDKHQEKIKNYFN